MKKSYITRVIGIIIAIALIYSIYGLMEKQKNNNTNDNTIKKEEKLNIDEDDHNNQYETTSEGEEFKNTLESVYMNLDEMVGKEVTLSGAIHREVDFTNEIFVISRILITPHGDHGHEEVAGLLCEYNDGGKFQENDWVQVRGIVDTTIYYNNYTEREEMIPILKATSVESIDPPEEKNIYVY